LLTPLVLDAALSGVFRALGGNGDIVAALGGVCAPLQPGVVLPANDVAISGANVRAALYETPQIAATISAGEGAMYSRVLAPGQTQVTAMLAQLPTFVSVEMATNEILPASSGLLALVTPYAKWQPAFDSLLDAVLSTGAGAVLVGLPRSAADFPSVRTAREFFSQWPYLLGLGIQVSISCYFSPNYIFVPGYLLSLVARAPTTATCQDVPGAVDYVLTPSDMTAVNTLMAQMNVHIQVQAAARGYAYSDIAGVYDAPKIPFNMGGVLFSSQPFGPYMSIDGVHPNAAGQAILAQAAANAIAAKYHVTIP
jgi:hypothetical protein